jgi:hypothetical protein
VKTTVYQLRLSPEKKAAWLETSKREGFKSLSSWIESRCDAVDRFTGAVPTEIAIVGNDGAVMSREAVSALSDRVFPPQKKSDRPHKGSFVRAGVVFCDDDCWCKGKI